MVNCSFANYGVCQKHPNIECTGAGIDLNGCPYWALVQAVQDLTEVQREIANYGCA